MRTSENSSDLERVPGTRSIADEFLEVRMAVQKLQRCEDDNFSLSRLQPFRIRTPPVTLPMRAVRESECAKPYSCRDSVSLDERFAIFFWIVGAPVIREHYSTNFGGLQAEPG